jgi:hypothetical protein
LYFSDVFFGDGNPITPKLGPPANRCVAPKPLVQVNTRLKHGLTL